MKLSELIKGCPGIMPIQAEAADLLDLEITGITSDSRQVDKGFLFISVKGHQVDGHRYIESALKKGAVAILAEENHNRDNRIILADQTRPLMGLLAAKFYGYPSQHLTLVGITGTNGKTTISWILESIFNAAGFNTGVIGTIDIRYNGRSMDNPITTPDAIDLQKTLFEMKQAGVTHVIMEVSSHGLVLNRVDGCRFDVGVFTNLTQDHLDYHADMDDYFAAKRQLFTRFLCDPAATLQKSQKTGAVLNIDDERGRHLFENLDCECLSVSREKKADIVSTNIKDTINGLSGTICRPNDSFEFSSALTGQFNLENILCAVGTATTLCIAPGTIKAGIEACRVVPGRLEKINNTIHRHLFVDYAHTPDALESILQALKKRAPKRLITVFGCGGDRDSSKRPAMGRIAGDNSHISIVTSDNPRTENPEKIIDDILAGMIEFTHLSKNDLAHGPFKTGYLVEPDRKKALALAVSISKPGDIVLAAGKGHETYQITNTGTIDFDDAKELSDAARTISEQFTPMDWGVNDLAEALKVSPICQTVPASQKFSSIGTDSRTIQPDQIFLALKGDKFDGHHFVSDLIKKGIKGFVVEQGFSRKLDTNLLEPAAENALLIFEVADTLIALGQLARYQRRRSKVKLVAITGSSGKTTTRKITQQIFETRFHTLATKGNLNNEIGLPLTLLNLSRQHEWAVVEMGMNHRGEISRLSQIAEPDITMITNTAGVHLEGLGTIENVAKAKAEIFDGIRKQGTAILWASDGRRNILESRARNNPNVRTLLFFGSKDDTGCTAEDIQFNATGIRFTAAIDEETIPIHIHSPAKFMVDNCLAAITAARCAGIDPETIQKGIAAFKPDAGRMNICTLKQDVQLIDDAYNANPASMGQALKTLADISKGCSAIAVLGDMLELGDHSAQLHYDIGEQIAKLNIDYLYLYGTEVEHLKKGAIENGFDPSKVFWAEKEQIVQDLNTKITSGSWILVKGSRGMAMETVIQGMKDHMNKIS